MKHPGDININDYTYDLPNDKIAHSPCEPRDASKLLIYDHGQISSSNYSNLPKHLTQNDVLIFNNTRVVQARLFFRNKNNALIEVFCLEPAGEIRELTAGMAQTKSIEWLCLVGNNKRWKDEFLTTNVRYNNQDIELKVSKKENLNGKFVVKFEWSPESLSFSEILEVLGNIPLPPYMQRQANENDKKTYQTVYANFDGSVAAPTAGLHFTKDLLANIKSGGTEELFTTLHVGAGTFKPVTADAMNDHDMHYEVIEIDLKLIHQLIEQIDKNFIPVGTTSMRTLESVYWLGAIAQSNPNIETKDLYVQQWTPYEWQKELPSKLDSLLALKAYFIKNGIERLVTKTQIIIAPGYEVKMVNGLITNFHQPKSTLILLVAALIGEDWRKIYDYALNHNFRFLSYGDGCLLRP